MEGTQGGKGDKGRGAVGRGGIGLGIGRRGKVEKTTQPHSLFFPFYNRHYIFMVVIVIIIIKCNHLKCKMESFIKQNIKDNVL